MSTNTGVLIFLLSGFSWEPRSESLPQSEALEEGWKGRGFGGSQCWWNICCNNETWDDLQACRTGPFVQMQCSWKSFVFVREHLKSWLIRVQVRNVSAQRSLVGMAHLLQIGCRNSNLCKTRLKWTGFVLNNYFIIWALCRETRRHICFHSKLQHGCF